MGPFGVRRTHGVRLTDDGRLVATFGFLTLDDPLANVTGSTSPRATAGTPLWAPGCRSSTTALTFGTNCERGVCIHFAEPVRRVIGMKPHSALTVTVADCDGLVEAIGADDAEAADHEVAATILGHGVRRRTIAGEGPFGLLASTSRSRETPPTLETLPFWLLPSDDRLLPTGRNRQIAPPSGNVSSPTSITLRCRRPSAAEKRLPGQRQC